MVKKATLFLCRNGLCSIPTSAKKTIIAIFLSSPIAFVAVKKALPISLQGFAAAVPVPTTAKISCLLKNACPLVLSCTNGMYAVKLLQGVVHENNISAYFENYLSTLLSRKPRSLYSVPLRDICGFSRFLANDESL
jgi:hypothetical protein